MKTVNCSVSKRLKCVALALPDYNLSSVFFLHNQSSVLDPNFLFIPSKLQTAAGSKLSYNQNWIHDNLRI